MAARKFGTRFRQCSRGYDRRHRAAGTVRLSGSSGIMSLLDRLLAGFVADGRMKLESKQYVPCYRVRV
ncbi:MAG: DUF3412 domain-containing protein [Woeseiaceae bacterium]|nr:DUF3412 domain-containing protein [Woeseiaceae bacterium]